jgi:hypothetical protein
MNAHVSISELADMLHGRSNPWKVIALMEAYFDESWIGPTGQRITALAGFMATANVLRALEDDWIEAWEPYKKQYGIETFHMTDCAGGYGEFGKIDTFFRRAIITRLSKVVGRHELQPVWSAVIDEDWDAIVTDANFLKRYPKPLDICFGHVVHQMVGWMRSNGYEAGVAPMFADHSEYNPRMKDVYDAYKHHPEWAKFLRPIAFGSPRQVICLQAADMLAYGIALDRRDIEYPKQEITLENIGPRKFLINMTGFHGLHVGGCYDALGLKNAVRDFRS